MKLPLLARSSRVTSSVTKWRVLRASTRPLGLKEKTNVFTYADTKLPINPFQYILPNLEDIEEVIFEREMALSEEFVRDPAQSNVNDQ